MTKNHTTLGRRLAFTSLALGLGVTMSVASVGQANADPVMVGLGAAESFAVLGHTTVTNTGPSIISGDLGLTPGSAVPGFPPGIMTTGNIHVNDGPANDAALALNTAYLDAEARTPPDSTGLTDLAGMSLVGGLYEGGALSNTGTLTLDGQGDATSIWIFQASSTLITDSSSTIVLTGDANPCNVFWQVGSSATIGTNSTMVGTVMALASISATTGANVEGRLLALTGAVTLDSNTVTVPAACAGTTAPGGTPTSPTVSTPPVPTNPVAAPDDSASLAESGTDAAPYLVAILVLITGGTAMMLASRASSRVSRNDRRTR